MHNPPPLHDRRPHDRRSVLRLIATLSTGALLAGCGGGGGDDSIVTPPTATAPPPAASSAHPLTLALTLAYLGGQYFSYAARGAPLPSVLTGTGAASATGARQLAFTDPAIARLAADLADDKAAHITALRGQIGASAPTQPAIDLSASAGGAFSQAAQRAGIVASGQSFDPYADDTHFLIGALLLENAVAATYRRLLMVEQDAASGTMVAAQLADSIYHGGMIRALLDDRAATTPQVDAMLARIGTMLAALDGTQGSDQILPGGDANSSNLLDAEGRPIPFTRTDRQVLSALYLSSTGPGGFLPQGVPGMA
ncbi:ferritin-like domain-containing protein [Sphingomonas fuzhouensis]|uniref:ferritin-like domain-containing protein n=1 Tax=Sphingomonas fuzhouensis TaxID=3106033 RepID=UPI002AFDCC49|nr:ferritin-like domain-containing protein [Sphingomonas sp. SGZ-02]